MMVLLIIALFLLGILLGMQIDEFFFLKEDKDKTYSEGYDEGYSDGYDEGSSSIDELLKEARRSGYAECMNDYHIDNTPTSFTPTPQEFLQQFEEFLYSIDNADYWKGYDDGYLDCEQDIRNKYGLTPIFDDTPPLSENPHKCPKFNKKLSV